MGSVLEDVLVLDGLPNSHGYTVTRKLSLLNAKDILPKSGGFRQSNTCTQPPIDAPPAPPEPDAPQGSDLTAPPRLEALLECRNGEPDVEAYACAFAIVSGSE